MPEFIIVQCFSCNHYQVNQRRMDGKFKCKICGAHQSVRVIVARSESAKQLRPVVQRANLTRGTAEDAFDQQSQHQLPVEPAFNHRQHEPAASNQQLEPPGLPQESRWAPYTKVSTKRKADHIDDQSDERDASCSEAEGVVTVLPDRVGKSKTRKKRFQKMAPPIENQQEKSEKGTSRWPQPEQEPIEEQEQDDTPHVSKWPQPQEPDPVPELSCLPAEDEQVGFRTVNEEEKHLNENSNAEAGTCDGGWDRAWGGAWGGAWNTGT